MNSLQEFLYTYGWALITIVASIIALLYWMAHPIMVQRVVIMSLP